MNYIVFYHKCLIYKIMEIKAFNKFIKENYDMGKVDVIERILELSDDYEREELDIMEDHELDEIVAQLEDEDETTNIVPSVVYTGQSQPSGVVWTGNTGRSNVVWTGENMKSFDGFINEEVTFNMDNYRRKSDYNYFTDNDKQILLNIGFDKVEPTYAEMVEGDYLVKLYITSGFALRLRVYHIDDSGIPREMTSSDGYKIGNINPPGDLLNMSHEEHIINAIIATVPSLGNDDIDL